jgi:hypothetical protein
MLRRVGVRLSISPFSMFMKMESKKPAYAGLTIGERGKLMARNWKKLTRAQKYSIATKAVAESYPKPTPKVTETSPAAKVPVLSDYNQFVQRNYSRFYGNPRRRMKSIAKAWRQRPV